MSDWADQALYVRWFMRTGQPNVAPRLLPRSWLDRKRACGGIVSVGVVGPFESMGTLGREGSLVGLLLCEHRSSPGFLRVNVRLRLRVVVPTHPCKRGGNTAC